MDGATNQLILRAAGSAICAHGDVDPTIRPLLEDTFVHLRGWMPGVDV
ncbi:hypothetical protein [Halorhabdus sp. SVX81]|nr:hypothetical protein [Halorhabdus sp. SVX81]